MKINREFSPITIVLETKEDFDKFKQMIDWVAMESIVNSEVENQAFMIQRSLIAMNHDQRF